MVLRKCRAKEPGPGVVRVDRKEGTSQLGLEDV